ncbi:hypothetical protein A5791_09530 [Mycobacterium sp. 852002-51163_SCH5372311]|uniref:DUF5995 family protein n=1 Tax=Mycobacterium sp. 852002-51163_SCH5372311 TaxID=1834097 RepID=UPI00080217CA|nr:DUF5995 family protein [Mycobacterium sp. 852002-51163_SCH5372311]OBF79990.1 hypothetical protein A5791_09530 [Mycobacterium sp. 852002-51163_SCH5372311]
MPPNLTPVDDVLDEIRSIIKWCKESASPLGYFAALYLRVTLAIKQAIQDDRFDDGKRMVDFDVTFARHYFDAFYAHRDGKKVPPQVWQVGFEDHDGKDPLIILQQLMTAMNAHIDLDLGVVTDEIRRKHPKASVQSLHHDFTAVNTVLSSQIPGVLNAICGVSPGTKTYRKWAGDNFVKAGLGVFREDAWRFACALAALPAAQRKNMIALRDTMCAPLGRWYIHPVPSEWIVDDIRQQESTDVAHIIDVLASKPAVSPKKLW